MAATVGLLFWVGSGGIFGVLLAVPLTAFVKLVADTQASLVHISNLLAESRADFEGGKAQSDPT